MRDRLGQPSRRHPATDEERIPSRRLLGRPFGYFGTSSSLPTHEAKAQPDRWRDVAPSGPARLAVSRAATYSCQAFPPGPEWHRCKNTDNRECDFCDLNLLGDTYDQAGNADSAVAYFERYVSTLGSRTETDAAWLARTLKRLGELHEAKGNREKAVEYYGRFVELWKNADPELQPLVSEHRERMARLAGEGDDGRCGALRVRGLWGESAAQEGPASCELEAAQ